ncbi:Hypothetical protein FKW44_005597 [Caligus rogercresseyi]|uniref:Uncharacterized protein n=1 Tax=Caligus rogercresseyi TaxID=217165 RepID=A0A7T8QS71_CALRO|nr:Hypothetical protein FKW44_005597 [Caligus rogercresseyi]
MKRLTVGCCCMHLTQLSTDTFNSNPDCRHRCCGVGSVRGTGIATRRQTMAGIWNKPKFPIPSST